MFYEVAKLFGDLDFWTLSLISSKNLVKLSVRDLLSPLDLEGILTNLQNLLELEIGKGSMTLGTADLHGAFLQATNVETSQGGLDSPAIHDGSSPHDDDR